MNSSEPLLDFLSVVGCQHPRCGGRLSVGNLVAVCRNSSDHRYSLVRDRRYLTLYGEGEGSKPDSIVAGPLYRSQRFAQFYAGLWSFAYAILENREFAARGWRVGRGESDSFYRTVGSIVVQALGGRVPERIWDIGCGVGRLTHDMAGLYPSASVVGIDESPYMLETCWRILAEPGDFEFDLEDAGFGVPRVRRSILPCRDNALLVLANAEELVVLSDRQAGSVDLVLLVNVLDRTIDPERLLGVATSVVGRGGLIVVAISGSWLTSELWRKYPDALLFCIEALDGLGFDIALALENVLLREVLNRRGATEDYPVSVVVGVRR